MEVKILEFDRKKKRISLGYRKEEDNPWFDAENLYQVGDILEVTVVRFANFGVFVNIAPGIDGLVHISQICEKRIRKPSEVLAVGDKVKVKVTAVKDGKLSLSIKEATDMMAKEVEEEEIEIPQSGEEATTSLGSLFANIKLN